MLSPVSKRSPAAPPGPVQYATPGTPSNTLNLYGTGSGAVTLGNVAAGTLSSTSTQAVNGSQLFTTNSNVAPHQHGEPQHARHHHRIRARRRRDLFAGDRHHRPDLYA